MISITWPKNTLKITSGIANINTICVIALGVAFHVMLVWLSPSPNCLRPPLPIAG